MAKTKVSEFDAVASNNTDINSVNVAEGCPPSGINNAIREMASLLKKQEVGTDAMTSPDIDGGTIDGATIGGSSGVTIGVSDGTVSAPSIKFTSDTNTGIYRGGTDILKFVTAGTDAITINASQNVDVAGGLTVETASGATVIIKDTGRGGLQLSQTGGGSGIINVADANESLSFRTNSIDRLNIASNGDISFYEDTGTTPKLFWDASAERLGIGNSSPTNILEISANSTNNGMLINNTSTGNPARITLTNDEGSGFIDQNNNLLRFNQSGSIDVVIDSSGSVGIGTDSPAAPLTVNHATLAGVRCEVSGSLRGGFQVGSSDAIIYAYASNPIKFSQSNGGSERMRIDSSGNLLVGTTNTAPSVNNVAGLALLSSGQLQTTTDSASAASFNRKTSNGSIINLRKDSSTVGSIGTPGNGDVYIADAGVGLVMSGSGTIDIKPCNSAGSVVDNVADFGASNARFDDIFATNGTIQTSDQQEKNTITDSDLGIDFIKRLTPKSYIFNGKTRTHYGLIAQDVETVLSDISKPTNGFAGFIKTDISEEQDGSEYRYGLRYTEFVAPLIQAVKDQQATIDALTARITALENGE